MTDRTWRTSGSIELHIAAPAQTLYEAVADVTQTGLRSEECQAADWLEGGHPGTVGARFRGRNKSGLARWSRLCEVVVAEPGKEFTFRTLPERIDISRADSTTWRYTFEPDAGGTKVVHSYEVTKLPMQPFRAIYGRLLPDHRDMRPQMQRNLEALRAAFANAPGAS